MNCYLTKHKLHATPEQYKNPQASNSPCTRTATGQQINRQELLLLFTFYLNRKVRKIQCLSGPGFTVDTLKQRFNF